MIFPADGKTCSRNRINPLFYDISTILRPLCYRHGIFLRLRLNAEAACSLNRQRGTFCCQVLAAGSNHARRVSICARWATKQRNSRRENVVPFPPLAFPRGIISRPLVPRFRRHAVYYRKPNRRKTSVRIVVKLFPRGSTHLS